MLNRVLLAIIILLVLVIAGGTLYAMLTPDAARRTAQGARGRANQDATALIATGKAVNLAEPVDTTDIAYYDLGMLRITTVNEDEENMLGVGMVLRPWLAYPAGDSVFYEELARKKNVMKAVCQHYFTERTKDEILSQSEEKITADLINQINASLSLGKISDIYFTDFLFLE